MTKGRTIEADRTASDSFGQVDHRLCIVSVAFDVSETGYSIDPLIPLKNGIINRLICPNIFGCFGFIQLLILCISSLKKCRVEKVGTGADFIGQQVRVLTNNTH